MVVANDKKHLISLTYQKIKNHSKSFDEVLDLTSIDVSQITDMSCLFSGDYIDAECSNDPIKKELIYFFNKTYIVNISNWNTSRVVDMSFMFEATKIKVDISHFDTSNVENMSSMFMESAFNGDISNWDVSKVRNMMYMFRHSAFNSDISKWDVSSVEQLQWMFTGTDFNQDISSWNVVNVKNMIGMFYDANFSHDISAWEMSKNTKTREMFGELKPLRFYVKALRTKNNQYQLYSMTSRIKFSKRLVCASRRARKVQQSNSKYRFVELRNTDKHSLKVLLRNLNLLSK
ncbi:hypothetical protein LA02_993 [Francisella philomiragia]|uniref:BspA family leucine-rich repeat surface protein n=1 Tax=Francisella philomiragia TaxID=28110 RepID=UPI0005A57F39|nr:BspA family leucine-rich repeat surface protein [Francisella philomiragia]AJI57266.1 hypothetical protein LA02_993 [Francisella philomiragia]